MFILKEKEGEVGGGKESDGSDRALSNEHLLGEDSVYLFQGDVIVL